jgi:hypothetical protein
MSGQRANPDRIDARFNREELISRIESIAKMRERIHLTRMDALKFLAAKAGTWGARRFRSDVLQRLRAEKPSSRVDEISEEIFMSGRTDDECGPARRLVGR